MIDETIPVELRNPLAQLARTPRLLGVKVGPGEIAAGYRVPRTEDVMAVLALLLEQRQAS